MKETQSQLTQEGSRGVAVVPEDWRGLLKRLRSTLCFSGLCQQYRNTLGSWVVEECRTKAAMLAAGHHNRNMLKRPFCSPASPIVHKSFSNYQSRRLLQHPFYKKFPLQCLLVIQQTPKTPQAVSPEKRSRKEANPDRCCAFEGSST